MCGTTLIIGLLTVAVVTGKLPYVAHRQGCQSKFEYFSNTGKVCCQKCQPGYFALSLCTKLTNTRCQPCPDGEFTEYWNYIRECRVCPRCDSRRGLEVTVNCTSRQKTKCQCVDGYHCVGSLDCMDCERHSSCIPGHEMVQPGTLLHDTQCRKCRPGTFKTDLSLGQCSQHTNCTAKGLVQLRQGSAVSNSLCGPSPSIPSIIPSASVWTGPSHPLTPTRMPRDGYSIVIPVFIAFAVILLLFLLVVLLCIRRRRAEGGRKDKLQTPADTDQTSLESQSPLLAADGTPPPQHRRIQGGRLDTDILQQKAAGWGGTGDTPITEPEAPPPQEGQRGEAHGFLGLQGCQVNSLSSNLTVHGPLYIYNGRPPDHSAFATSGPASDPAGPDSAHTGPASAHTGPDSANGQDSWSDGLPVPASPEQESGYGSTQESCLQGERLVQARQEQGTDV